MIFAFAEIALTITSGITSDTDSTLSSIAYCVSVGDSKEWRDTIDDSGNVTGRSQYISGLNICNEVAI